VFSIEPLGILYACMAKNITTSAVAMGTANSFMNEFRIFIAWSNLEK